MGFRYILELCTDNLRIIGVLSLNALYSMGMVVMGLRMICFIDNSTHLFLLPWYMGLPGEIFLFSGLGVAAVFLLLAFPVNLR